MIRNKLPVLMAERYIKLAELQRLTKIDKSSLTRLYHGKATLISFKSINALCKALEVTPNELFGYTSD